VKEHDNLISSDRIVAARHREPSASVQTHPETSREPGNGFSPVRPQGKYLQRNNYQITGSLTGFTHTTRSPASPQPHNIPHFSDIHGKTRMHMKNNPEKTGAIQEEQERRTMGTGNPEINKTVTTIEPVTTVIDEGQFLRILTELPGIEEKKIRIDLENNSTSVTIVAVNTVKQFKKVITIPCEVRFSKKRFSDGVLELTLEKNKR
jgi:HSP20 family molecular chaperone IbpA